MSQLSMEGFLPTTDQRLEDPFLTETSSELPWEPQSMRPKGSIDPSRYWIVENTKQCLEFCKAQLKLANVHDPQCVANGRTMIKQKKISNFFGHLK